MRIAGRARRGDGEFGGHRLARDQRTGGAQPVDDGGLPPGEHLGRQRRTRPGGQSVGVHDVLDAHRDAVQRGPAAGLARTAVRRPARRLQEPRTPSFLGHEGPHLRVDGVDPVARTPRRVDGVVRPGPQRRGFPDEGAISEQGRHTRRLQPPTDSGRGSAPRPAPHRP
ncbi:hypothetical protein GCM10012285_20440 [Streptomyces kronopolitis]|uniref:Uncharacterized protein n=1 Tax=Streptomyces kronopolitis TaxID=1612435 RepID=A0ABQ2JAD3_9ACTN|nr:hypothetical protein GCM10012285_20440 [Streptomyces kronopolitis]